MLGGEICYELKHQGELNRLFLEKLLKNQDEILKNQKQLGSEINMELERSNQLLERIIKILEKNTTSKE